MAVPVRRWVHVLKYLGFVIAKVIVRTMPLSVSYALADAVGELWYLASPRLRGILAHNLSLIRQSAGQSQQGGLSLRSIARSISRNFGHIVVEFFYVSRLNRKSISEMVDLESFCPLAKYAKPPGAVFVTAHLGNWELAGTVIAMMGIRLAAVVYDDPDPRIARLFRRSREARGIRVIPVRASSKDLTAAVSDSSLGVVADRDFSGRGMMTTFLGRPARMPFAYAGLALSRGLPVVFGVCVRLEDGKYHLILEEDIGTERTVPEAGHPGTGVAESAPEWARQEEAGAGATQEQAREVETDHAAVETASERARAVARQCIRMIEKNVEKYPEQWYLFEKIGGERSKDE